ncbi:hypothetical protein L3X38_026837 [Prunus dulcis]|uniref:RNase H type-1 domain-containing protein n=1 Tax=Prunus dulcis TaxID=3755 RepID=A0AAD4YZQ1_PRUDU|nr:hypothetical protein L3X38_026837 [Prunus dulcis]
MERFKFQLGFHGSVAVRRRGLSGGLLLLWKEGWSVSVNSFSIAHIDVFATIPNGFSFRFTEFYVHLEPSQRHHSWELLRRLSYGNLRPWICIGDFNEVVYEWEKSGGRDRSRLTMDAFKDVFNNCALCEVSMRADFLVLGREGVDFILKNFGWRRVLAVMLLLMHGTPETKPVIGCLSPKAFEALAMLAGCQMTIDAGFTRMIIESDCLEMINAVNQTEFDMSMEGELIEELKELLRRFVFVSLQHQPRTCNFVTHQLAKFTLSCNEICYWMEEGPSWLHSYLQNDLRSLHSIDE